MQPSAKFAIPTYLAAAAPSPAMYTFWQPSRAGIAMACGGARSLESGEGRPNGQDGLQPGLFSPGRPGLCFVVRVKAET